jgi:hypothetical protein
MENKSEFESTLKMIADYMEKGFLENIIDMFKNDKSYYPFIGNLLGRRLTVLCRLFRG